MEEHTSDAVLEIDEIAEAMPVKAGAVDGEGIDFYYYPHKPVRYQGKLVEYFHLDEPTQRKMKANKVSISEEVSALQMENLISACTIRIVVGDDEELPSSVKRTVIGDVKYSDMVLLFAESQKRFLEALTD
jgi:hypothetical protein